LTTIADLDAFRLRWWGKSSKDTIVDALETYGVGKRITALTDAKPGDFIQIWRHNGSGHCAVFSGWLVEHGKITGVRYWCVQSTTAGIGYNTERFGRSGTALDRSTIAIGRVGV
jgi:hypothetical protein